MTRDELEQLSDSRLKELAAQHFKVTNQRRETLIERLAEVSPEKADSDAVKVIGPALSEPQPRVRILIPEQEGASDGSAPVKVGLNGRVFVIQRDKEVEVPEAVCGILDNAIGHRFVPIDGTKPMTPDNRRYVQYKRYPYQRL